MLVTIGAIGIAVVVIGLAATLLTGNTPTPPSAASGSGSPVVVGGASLVVPTVLSPVSLADGRAIGRADAPATMTVWEDFQCPVCGEFTRVTEPRLYDDYVRPGKLRIVYRDFAFIGQESLVAAAAARCAGEQGKFWPYHDYLFWNQGSENSGAFDRPRLDAIAGAVGLDMSAFDSCLQAGRTLTEVQSESTAAANAGIQQTPSLVLGRSVIPGAAVTDEQYRALATVIDAEIAAHSASASPGDPGASAAP